MNREETKKAIAVMQHYADGGEVAVSENATPVIPSWNWSLNNYCSVPRSWQVGDTGKLSTGQPYVIEEVLSGSKYKYVVSSEGSPILFLADGSHSIYPSLRLSPPDQPKVENLTDREKHEVLGILQRELHFAKAVRANKMVSRLIRVIRYIENH